MDLLEFLKRNSFFEIKHRALWTMMADTSLYHNDLTQLNVIQEIDFDLIPNFSELNSIIKYFEKIRGEIK